MVGIRDYSTTAANNTTVNSVNLAENVMLPSDTNNAIRQVMADVRSDFEAPEWIDLGYTFAWASSTSVTVAGVDVTAQFVANRRVKAVGSVTGTIYGKVASSSFSTNTTINFTWDSGSLTNESLTITAGRFRPTGKPIDSSAISGSFGNMVNTGASTSGHIPKYTDTTGAALADGYGVDTDTTLAANSDANVATQKAVKAYVSGLCIAGHAVNARMSVTAAAATGTFTASQVLVKTTLSGSALLLSSYSQSVNLAATGAGGMDTGSAPASGFVSLYAIAKSDGTTSILACSAATSTGDIYAGSNMPSGYTLSALLGVWPTNGSSNLVVGIQHGRRWWGAQTNPLNAGTQTTFTSVSISASVPPNAVMVFGSGGVSSASNGVEMVVSSDGTGTGTGKVTFGDTTTVSGSYSIFSIPIITSQTVYYKLTSSGSAYIYVSGYEF